MSQLAAVQNLLYYPTDPDVVKNIAKNFRYYANGSKKRAITLLDICAGDGRAMHDFAKNMQCYNPNIKMYGVEIEEGRSKIASSRYGIQMVHGSAFDYFIGGPVDIIWANPPYDDDSETGRMEITWLSLYASAMMEDASVLVYVIPEKFFGDGQWAKEFNKALYKNKLRPINCGGSESPKYLPCAYRFPEDKYEWKQCVVFLKKSHDAYQTQSIPVVPLNKLSASFTQGYSDSSEIVVTEKPQMTFQPSWKDSKLTTTLYGAPGGVSELNPLQKIRPEIAAAMLAGGAFSGIDWYDEEKGMKAIIRGGTYATMVEVALDEGDNVIETVRRKVLVTTISALYENGDHVIYRSGTTGFNDFAGRVSKKIVDKIMLDNPPLASEEYLLRTKSTFGNMLGPKGKGSLFDVQVSAGLTVLKGWKTSKAIVLLGEMGTGKTIISIAATAIRASRLPEDERKVIVVIPAKKDLAEKWLSEVKNILRKYNPNFVEVESISDVDKAFAMKGLTYIIVRESMAKSTSGWMNVPMKTRLRSNIRRGTVGKSFLGIRSYHKENVCFNCGKSVVLVDRDGNTDANPEKSVLYCPSCGVSYFSQRRHNKKAKVSMAHYIKDRYKGKYLLILDEAHKLKGESARGFMSHALITGAKNILMMTGTLYSGLARSLFYQLYRTMPYFRKDWGYEDAPEFAISFGLVEETTIKKKKHDYLSWSNYNTSVSRQVKEIPGMHPAMIAMMLPHTVFIRMNDMDFTLPVKREKKLFLDFGEGENEVNSYLDRVLDLGISMMKDGDRSVLGKFNFANSGVWDIAHMGESIEKIKLDPVKTVKGIFPKEEALLRICQSRVKNGPVLVYETQPGVRPIGPRIKYLAENLKTGLNVVELPSTEDERKKWITNQLEKGANVVIVNPALVEEGIDLVEFKTIIWYGCSHSSYMVAQANRRIWRIGQEDEVEIWYLAYNGTAQADTWERTGAKLKAMDAMNGDVVSGIAALTGGDDLIITIQRQVVKFPSYESNTTIDDIPDLVVVEAKKKGTVATKLSAPTLPAETQFKSAPYTKEQLANAVQMTFF